MMLRLIHRRSIMCAVLVMIASAMPAQADDTIFFPAVDNVTAILVDRINRETVRIDMSAWYLTERAISTALVNRFRAGVPVRLLGDRAALFENDVATKREFYWLASQGIPIRLRYQPTWYPDIDHWKATIFAGQNLVSFGSANYTPFELAPVSPNNYKDETVMFSTDPAIVNGFRTKFDRFWNDTTPDPGGHVAAPPYFKNFNDACALEPGCADYRTLFPSPQPMVVNTSRLEPDYPLPADIVWSQGPAFNQRLVAEIDRETTRVDIVIYRLTAASVADALERKVRQGVPVRIIIEPEQYMNRAWPEYWLTHIYVDRLLAAGASVKQRAHAGLTHMKMLVTSEIATNASSNFAEFWQRDHNYFVSAALKPAIHEAMRQRFETMWNDAVAFSTFVPQPPDAPASTAPATGAADISTRPTLTWQRAAFASSYDVYLGTAPSTLALVGTVAAQLGNNPPATYSWTPSTDLQGGITYYWSIVSKTAATQASGATWSFTTGASSRLVGGYFDANGFGDLLFQRSDGSVTMGRNAGGSFQTQTLFDGATTWRIAGVGNFDRVGNPDVVWQHPNGSVMLWAFNSSSTPQMSYLFSGTTSWRVVAVADIDRDGYPDLIWQYPTGQVIVWFMQGLTMRSGQYLWESNSDYRLAAVGDFNGDGNADIVWQHPAGTVVMWLMQGATRLSSTVVFGGTTPWQVVAASDLDGNGRSDLVWRGPANFFVVWTMNGAVTTGALYLTLESQWRLTASPPS